MHEARLCTACAAWLCSADDAWCGRCGEPCAILTLAIEPAVLQAGQLAPKIFLKLTNESCTSLPVSEIDLPPWLTLSQPALTQVGPMQIVTVSGSAKTLGMTQPDSATISVVTPAGKASTLLMVIDERPSLICTPPVLEIWDTRQGSGETRNVPLTIAPVSGFLRIREIQPGPTGGLNIISDLQNGVLASPRNGAPVVVLGSADRLRSVSTASFVVLFDGPHGIAKAEVPIRVAVRNPPQIRWVGEHQAPEERLQTGGQAMKFVLMNQAPDGYDGGTNNAMLSIKAATLTPPLECSDAPVRLRSQLPVDVPGGQEFTMEFDLGIENVRPQERVPFHFTLHVETNGPTLDKPVSLFIRAMPEFDGILAIDFGSSNTCCALVETGRDFEKVPLDGDSAVSPTVLRYLDLSGPLPLIETGARVKNLAAKSEEAAASIMDKLKQRLGDTRQDIPVRPKNATAWTTRTATEAASDYLGQLRRAAEAGKKTVFREFILTHPAVCSLLQYRNLSLALQKAFGDQTGHVYFLQEPIAALIPFLADQAAKPGQPGYTVASFDLGGGTTDLALVRVEHRVQPSGRVDIHPTILHCRGVRFGGEDLTEFLEGRLAANCQRLLEEQRPGAKLIARGLSGASMDDILLNRLAFREAAEQFKASLGGPDSPREPSSVILRVQPAPGEAAANFTADFNELRLAGEAEQPGGNDLRNQFLHEASSRVGDIARLLRTAVDAQGPVDHIQLSGLTTLLPVVGDVIRRMFPGVPVVRANDPKECVVTGACLSRSLSRGTQRRLILPPASTQRTTSSIGIFDTESGTFTTIIPIDAAIPVDGLTGQVAGAWYGSERVPIFENLGAGQDELKTAAGKKLLSKLGTWKPDRIAPEAEDNPWTLCVQLKNFELEVSALGPAGETVIFRRLTDGGVG